MEKDVPPLSEQHKMLEACEEWFVNHGPWQVFFWPVKQGDSASYLASVLIQAGYKVRLEGD